MKKVSLFKSLMLAFAAIPFASFAEGPKFTFEENKNQWPEQVKFQVDIPGGKLFLEQNMFSYLYMEKINLHRTNIDPAKVKYHSYKVNFENSNPDVKILGNNLFPDHRNYYIGNDPSKWAEKVPLYGQVYYKDLYANIDMKVYNVESNLKYDLIIHPGGNAKNIKLNYNGPDEMHLQYGHLFIKTSVCDLIEQKPYAYQEINGEKKTVACSYVLKKNVLSFELGNYNPDLPLIIDPTLIASTYTGSNADNFGFTATYDAAGNIYAGGNAYSAGYVTTVGPAYAGGTFDISFTKFNPTGTARVYATYYGGSGKDQPHSMVVNSNDELYITGRSNSGNFPTTNTYGTSFQTVKSTGFDIIVGKFSPAGTLLASTFVGGNADDGLNFNETWNVYGGLKFNYADDGRSEIIVDVNSNIYVASCTMSSNFPAVGPGADNTRDGTQDGVVFKMNGNLTAMTWSTYLGGSVLDAAYGIKFDPSFNVYVTGGTTSADFPLTAGHLKPTYGGNTDGFIAVFNSTGTLQRSTYLGTTAYDQSYLIEIDASADLYVYGQTQGAYPVTSGVYTVPNSGQFIHKITGNLNTTVFSTVFGNGPAVGTPRVNLSPVAFLVDSCQRIYISGWQRCLSADYGPMPGAVSAANSNLPLSASPHQSATDNCDFYFMVLDNDAKALDYATYFGEVNPPSSNGAGAGDHVDGGTSRFDSRGVIYNSVCASCTNDTQFPTTPGAYGKGAGACNNAVVKMDFSVKPYAAASAPATIGCNTLSVPFSSAGSTATGAIYYFWNFGDGYTSTLANPSHTFTSTATPPQYTFTVTLEVTDSVGICGIIDTATVVIKVGKSAALTTTQTNIVCPGPSAVGSATVTATGGMPPLTYAWTPNGATTPIVTNLTLGNHTVTVTDAFGCDSTVVITITEIPPLALTPASSGATCGVANGTASVTVTGGTLNYTYAWTDTSGATIGTTAAVNGLFSSTYTVLVTDVNGCTSTQIVSVPVVNGPTVTTAIASPILCNGGTGSASAALSTTGTGPYTYLWTPGGQTDQTATGLTTGTYVIVITDAMGCSAQTSVNIPEPPALVPTISPTHVLCFGYNTGSATLNTLGGTGAYTYLWSPGGQITQNVNGLPAGPYTVTVTDANGCTKTASTNITQPANGLAVTTATSGFSCGTSANGIISATVISGTGTPPYNYSWQPGGQTTPVILNIVGNSSHTVTITDANGCTSTSAATMPTSVQPVADFNFAPTISCEGVYVQFTDASTGAVSWSWNFGGVGSSTAQHPGFVFPYNGTYNVTLTVTNPPCDSTISKPVVIGDMSEYFKMEEANVFTPNADNINDCFLPALSGAGADTLKACLELKVFDRWGVKMFESIGSDNCWNGNNRKDSKPALDGTYYYIAKLGNTTIRGYVTLARHK